MAEPLHALTALCQRAPQTRDIGPFRITERFDVALASLAVRRGREAEVVASAQAIGLPLPAHARAVTGTPYAAFWISPDMWMVEAPFASHEDIVARLKPAFGDGASVTEQTDAWVRFDVTAPALQPLIERLCNVDLAQAPVGFATRTVIEHTGCYLIRRAAGEVTLYGPRSSAHSLLHAVEVAAASVA